MQDAIQKLKEDSRKFKVPVVSSPWIGKRILDGKLIFSRLWIGTMGELVKLAITAKRLELLIQHSSWR